MRFKIIILILSAYSIFNLTPAFSEEDSTQGQGEIETTSMPAEETSDRNRIPDVPMHKANLGVNVGLWKYANAHLNTFISGPRPREDGDTRVDLPSYALVNLTLIGRNLIDNFEIRGSVFNLFDKDYEYPAPVDTVPTDYPQQERSFMVELRYQF